MICFTFSLPCLDVLVLQSVHYASNFSRCATTIAPSAMLSLDRSVRRSHNRVVRYDCFRHPPHSRDRQTECIQTQMIWHGLQAGVPIMGGQIRMHPQQSKSKRGGHVLACFRLEVVEIARVTFHMLNKSSRQFFLYLVMARCTKLSVCCLCPCTNSFTM